MRALSFLFLLTACAFYNDPARSSAYCDKHGHQQPKIEQMTFSDNLTYLDADSVWYQIKESESVEYVCRRCSRLVEEKLIVKPDTSVIWKR